MICSGPGREQAARTDDRPDGRRDGGHRPLRRARGRRGQRLGAAPDRPERVGRTAEAGAIVLAQRSPASTAPAGGWDAEVAAKIQASAAANNLTSRRPTTRTSAASRSRPTARRRSMPTAPRTSSTPCQVGTGGLPGGTATTPDCPSLTVGPVAGVHGPRRRRRSAAYVARARRHHRRSRRRPGRPRSTGYLQGYCGASQGNVCAPAGHDPGEHHDVRRQQRPDRHAHAVGPGTRSTRPAVQERAGQRRLARLGRRRRRRARARVLDPQPGQPGDRPAVVAVRRRDRQHQRGGHGSRRRSASTTARSS